MSNNKFILLMASPFVFFLIVWLVLLFVMKPPMDAIVILTDAALVLFVIWAAKRWMPDRRFWVYAILAVFHFSLMAAAMALDVLENGATAGLLTPRIFSFAACLFILSVMALGEMVAKRHIHEQVPLAIPRAITAISIAGLPISIAGLMLACMDSCESSFIHKLIGILIFQFFALYFASTFWLKRVLLRPMQKVSDTNTNQ